MDWSSLPWADIGSTGLLALVVLMILRGALVPRQVLEDVRADRDARVAEKQAEVDALRVALATLESVCEVQAEQATQLLEVGRTAEHVLRSLPTGNGG